MNTSKITGLVLAAVGAVAVIIALILSFIPWGIEGSGGPTAAFAAQNDLDDTAFQYGTSPGAKYSGSLTRTYSDGDVVKVEFTDLIVTLSENASGTITVDNQQAEYTQIGNYYFAKGPTAFWNGILTEQQKENLDLGPVDNKWASAEAALPKLGYVLSPNILAGRLNADLVDAPDLGAQLSTPNKDTPDARFWPTSDPPITAIGDNQVKTGEWTITFDPSTKAITHIKGSYKVESTTTAIDADVTPLPFAEVSSVFTEQHSLVADLTSVPIPGLQIDDVPGGQAGQVGWKQTGGCTTAACGYDFTVGGTPAAGSDGRPGHVNYGLKVNFIVNDLPAGALGGTCSPVVRTDFDRTAGTRCTATNLGSGDGSIKPNVTYTYLPFLDYTADRLNSYIDDNSTATQRQFTMMRTGSKKPDAANYGFSVTALPSSYAVKAGDYLFDGYGPAGDYLVSFAEGYAQHVTGTTFDPSWPGTQTLRDQMRQQIQAVGDNGSIAYYAAEQSTTDALKAMVAEAGYGDKIFVFYSEPED